MTEYLRNYGKEAGSTPGWKEIIETGEPIERSELTNFLSSAYLYLATEPGPHLDQRRELSYDWLGWWVRHLNSLSDETKPSELLPLNEISKYRDEETETGVLFAGGMEGHKGHRNAVDWMSSFVKPVILFEQDEYLTQKDRNAPFLPLGVRLSMWSYYSPDLTLSVLPEKNPEVEEGSHYQQIFDMTGADYCFATERDPNQAEKRGRGKEAHFTLIPFLDTPSTTQRVKRLFPE